MTAAVNDKNEISSNADLVGKQGSRALLDTPCLIADIEILHNNIAEASKQVRDAGKSFSPHLKAHKTPEIARLQQSAGADGFCVATIGEAEVFAEEGVGPLTITSTFATDRQINRIAALSLQEPKLTVVVDHPRIIERLAELNVSLDVLIDVDMGRGRSACSSERQAVQLSQAVIETPNLKLAGLQCYAGHLSHMNSFVERQRGAAEADARTLSFLNAVCTVATRPLRCSGGSTGASCFDLKSTALTELQWGSYAVMDVEYGLVEGTAMGDAMDFKSALTVGSRVISTGHDAHVVMDAGDKRFASKYGAAPLVVAPKRNIGAAFNPVSDEHGEMRGPMLPDLGSMIEIVPPHCDPTINLFDVIHVVQEDTLIDIWPIAARGRY